MTERKKIWLYQSYSDKTDRDAVNSVLKRGSWWIKGKEITEFERKLSEYVGVEHAVTFNSGTSGLFASLLANNVKGGEVILPSFTYVATADAVVNAGAKPVFADIERDTFGLDVESVKNRVNDKTKAIICMHYLGNICRDVKKIKILASDKHIPFIEDAAHALGATLDNKKAGSFSDSAMFSFSFNKIITTGEGGAVVTDSDKLCKKLRLIRSHGQTSTKDVILPGFNIRMSSMTAALGISQLQKIEELIKKRNQIAMFYKEEFKDLPVYLPQINKDKRCVFQRFSIVLNDKKTRDDLVDYLKENGIDSTKSYQPVHLFSYFKETYGYDKGLCPVAESVSDRMIVIPFHLLLSESELAYISNTIKKFFKK